ncbi:hypothetical protein ACIB24_12575 [Spongisporangium articulatum]|uniref:Uncharacterized protein n=1 Tax=Spongisporangium articulatum TaxID=3362603 RepID=A0ABW8ANE8_9ACTN
MTLIIDDAQPDSPIAHAPWCDPAEHRDGNCSDCTSRLLETPAGAVFLTQYDGATRIVLLDPPRDGVLAITDAVWLVNALQELIATAGGPVSLGVAPPRRPSAGEMHASAEQA